ncbi:MAG: class I tRNA ligase family protein [Deltaproteobacteria bacterium]|nr:class I tRNA ligase family protein [Deltaproteobacteria bacterium]
MATSLSKKEKGRTPGSAASGTARSSVPASEDEAKASIGPRVRGGPQFRYFLLREVPFGLDGDFSTTALVGRINGELANDLGNLLSRTIAMTIKYFDGVVPAPCSSEEIDRELIRTAIDAVSGLEGAMKEVAFQRGLTNIWSLVSFANKYIETNAPWALAKDEAKKERLQTVIYNTLESLRVTAILISPFMPDTAAKMWEALNIPTLFDEVKIGDAGWGGLKTGITLSKPAPLFPRVEEK